MLALYIQLVGRLYIYNFFFNHIATIWHLELLSPLKNKAHIPNVTVEEPGFESRRSGFIGWSPDVSLFSDSYAKNNGE